MIEKIEDFTLGKKRVSNSDTINKFGIIGGGAMGQEIAVIVSSAGLDVVRSACPQSIHR